jgi:hypothetical protein
MVEKSYKVAQVISHTYSGTYAFIMLAPDGDCWYVERAFNCGEPLWQAGECFSVPTMLRTSRGGDREFTPHWAVLSCSNPMRIHLYDVHKEICSSWGPEMADSHADRLTLNQRRQRVLYTPDRFAPSHGFTSHDKAQMINQFDYFMRHGCSWRFFSRSVHRGLTRLFAFKPGETQLDFYRRWFSSRRSIHQFVRHISEYVPTANPPHGHADLEFAIQAVVIQRYLRQSGKRFVTPESHDERRVLRDLLRRHGMPTEWCLPGQFMSSE